MKLQREIPKSEVDVPRSSKEGILALCHGRPSDEGLQLQGPKALLQLHTRTCHGDQERSVQMLTISLADQGPSMGILVDQRQLLEMHMLSVSWILTLHLK